MKTSQLLPLAWATTVLASPLLDKRQGPFFFSPIQKPMRVQETEGTIKPGSKHVNVIYGPFEIPAGSQTKAASSGGHGAMNSNPLESLLSGDGLANLFKPNGIEEMMHKMPGFSMDPGGFTVTRRINEGICKDCTILKGRIALTDEKGDTISIGSGVYLHHIGFLPNQMSMSPQIVSSSCKLGGAPVPGLGGLPDMLFVQGVENFTTWYTAPDGSMNSGYYAPKDGWGMIMEVVNYKPEKRNVYISTDYEYLPGKPETTAKISYVSVTGCLMPGPGAPPGGFVVKAGRSTVEGKEMPITQDGTILSMRGHMHDGGSGLKLFINDKEVCDSLAKYGGSESTLAEGDGKKWETISAMGECNRPIKVQKGDKLRIIGEYDTVAHPARTTHGAEAEEMGIYFLTFVPDKK